MAQREASQLLDKLLAIMEFPHPGLGTPSFLPSCFPLSDSSNPLGELALLGNPLEKVRFWPLLVPMTMLAIKFVCVRGET